MNILCALFTLTYLTRSSSPAQFLLITRGCLTSNQNQITFLDIFLPIRKCPVRWRNEWRYSLIYDFKNWSARNWTYLKLMGSQGASCFYIPPAADGMKWEFLNHAHPQRPRWSGGCFFIAMQSFIIQHLSLWWHGRPFWLSWFACVISLLCGMLWEGQMSIQFGCSIMPPVNDPPPSSLYS